MDQQEVKHLLELTKWLNFVERTPLLAGEEFHAASVGVLQELVSLSQLSDSYKEALALWQGALSAPLGAFAKAHAAVLEIIHERLMLLSSE